MDPNWHDNPAWRNPLRSHKRIGDVGAILRKLVNAADGPDRSAVVTLDPYPGRLGEALSLTAKLPSTKFPIIRYSATLRCMQHSQTPSHDDDDDLVVMVWEQDLALATQQLEADGVRLTFDCGNVPSELPESTLPLAGQFHDWQLLIIASGYSERAQYTFSLPVFHAPLPKKQRNRPTNNDEDVPAEVRALVSEWQNNGAWEERGVEIGIQDKTLVLTIKPTLTGFPYKLCLMLALTLVFMVGGLMIGELVPVAVSGAFGLTGLFLTGTGGYVLLRKVEVRACAGQLSRLCTVRGIRVEAHSIAGEDIAEFTSRAGSDLFSGRWGHALYAGVPNVELIIVDGIEDRSLISKLRKAMVQTIFPDPAASR